MNAVSQIELELLNIFNRVNRVETGILYMDTLFFINNQMSSLITSQAFDLFVSKRVLDQYKRSRVTGAKVTSKHLTRVQKSEQIPEIQKSDFEGNAQNYSITSSMQNPSIFDNHKKDNAGFPSQKTSVYKHEGIETDRKISLTPLVALHRIEALPVKYRNSSTSYNTIQKRESEGSALNTLPGVSQASPSGPDENKITVKNEPPSPLVVLHKIEPSAVKYRNSSPSDNIIEKRESERYALNSLSAVSLSSPSGTDKNKITTKNQHLSPLVMLHRIEPLAVKYRNSSPSDNIIEKRESEKSALNSLSAVSLSSPSGTDENKITTKNEHLSPLVMLHKIELLAVKYRNSSPSDHTSQKREPEESALNSFSGISQPSPSGTVANKTSANNKHLSPLVVLHKIEPSAVKDRNSSASDDANQKCGSEKISQNRSPGLSQSNPPPAVEINTAAEDERQSKRFMERKLKAIEKRIRLLSNSESSLEESSNQSSNKRETNFEDRTANKSENSCTSPSNTNSSCQLNPTQQNAITVIITNRRELVGEKEKIAAASNLSESIDESVYKDYEKEKIAAVLNRHESQVADTDHDTSVVLITNEICHVCDTCNEYIDIINNDLDLSIEKHYLSSRHVDRESIFRKVSDSLVLHREAKISAVVAKPVQLGSSVGAAKFGYESTGDSVLSFPVASANSGYRLDQVSRKRTYTEAMGCSSKAYAADDVNNNKKMSYGPSAGGGMVKNNKKQIDIQSSKDYQTHMKGKPYLKKEQAMKKHSMRPSELVQNCYSYSKFDFPVTNAKSRFCFVCSLGLNNDRDFQTHMRSAKHNDEVRLAYEKMCKSDRFFETKNGIKWCSLCKITCPGPSQFVAHIQSVRHCRKLPSSNY